VSNHDAFRTHEHLFDQQAQDALPLFDRGCFGTVLEAAKKLLEVFGQGNIRLSIEYFALQGVKLGAKRRLLLSKVWHAFAQLLKGHQLLLVALHQSSDRSRTATELNLQSGFLGRRGIRCSEITKTPVNLVSNQSRVC
jgi:hypothetical protein